jgi:hypothetical protein
MLSAVDCNENRETRISSLLDFLTTCGLLVRDRPPPGGITSGLPTIGSDFLPQSFSYGRLEIRALAAIFSGSRAHLSTKNTTERTRRSVSNG